MAKFFDPDSRMEELGLMAGDHEGGGRPRLRRSIELRTAQALAGQKLGCGGDDLVVNLRREVGRPGGPGNRDPRWRAGWRSW